MALFEVLLYPWACETDRLGRWASDEGFEFQYFMHADDDSFIRLDLLLESLDVLPRERFVLLQPLDGS